MVWRRGYAYAALALLLASGCLGSPSSGPEKPPDPAVEFASPIVMTGCIDQTGRFPVAMADLQAQLPDPLVPTALDPAGAYGQTWILAARCSTVVGGGLTLEDATFLFHAILVASPKEYRPEDANALVAVTRVEAADDALAALLADWGQGAVTAGDVSFDVEEGPVRVGRSRSASTAFDVVAATPENVIAPDFFRFFLVKDTKLVGAIDWRTTEGRVQRGTATLGQSSAGQGGHFWGDGYGYNLTFVPADLLTWKPPPVNPPAGLAEPVQYGFKGRVVAPGAGGCGVPANPVTDALEDEKAFDFEVPAGARFVNSTLQWESNPLVNEIGLDLFDATGAFRGGAYSGGPPATGTLELKVGDEGTWTAVVYNCQNPPTEFTLGLLLK